MNLSTIDIQTPSDFFRYRNVMLRLFLAIMIALTLLSALHTDLRIGTFFSALPRVASWIIAHVVPDAAAWSRLPSMLEKLAETVFLSVMATTTAAVLAFLFAVMGSQCTRINGFFAIASRAVASVSRNIPIAAWALIFLVTFGMSAFTGYLALFFASFGFLTRAFMETIDEASDSQVEALRATGASYSHIIAQAVIPATIPQMISWVLYMVETNIRDATLVGLLTGSGIGFLFDLYYKTQQYKSASLIVILLVIVVMTIEFLSNHVRRKIL